MKCPKCGYLGFETTDRCRNCQYDFSLAPLSSEPELTLHGTDRNPEPLSDLELPPIKRQSDKLSATALDLDRLFGDPEPRSPLLTVSPHSSEPPPMPEAARRAVAAAPAVEDPIAAQIASYQPPVLETTPPVLETTPPVLGPPEPSIVEDTQPLPDVEMSIEGNTATPEQRDEPAAMAVESAEGALPFDDAPIVPPPAARPPLAVRRSTPEVPRNRPRPTRSVRTEALDLEPQARSGDTALAAGETVASLMEMPSLAVRVGAGLIDLLLLVSIDAMVLYLTLRVTGLQNTLEDLRVLPPVPFVGFLAVLGFGYVAAFTVAGGQTIGKMMLSLRVIGDDGRPVDAAGGMLRALGCMLVPITLGLSYLPALFTSDHRALHDRLAGTRVVQE